MRIRIVPELDHARVAIERRLHDAALHAAPAAVHHAHLVEAGRRRRVHVVGNHTRNVARRERMEIDLALDRKADGKVVSRQSLVPSESLAELT